MLRKLVFTLFVVVIAGSVWFGAVSALPLEPGQETVTVCHKPGTLAEATLEVAAPAEAAHLRHGDYQGACQGPQSDGCNALNAVVADPQTDPFFYYFEVSGLDFLPGETIHVDMTITGIEGSTISIGVTNSDSDVIYGGDFFVYPGGQDTGSIDYVIVAGDDADGVLGIAYGNFTLNSMNFSCTPAP